MRVLHLFAIFFLLVCSHLPGFAQDDIKHSGFKGAWFGPEEVPALEDWQASWIWLDEDLEEDVLLARRNFVLTQIPQKAQLKITASSQYQLFINGVYVCRGPARSAPHHQSFDILDIKTLLLEGKNCIAVRVHHQKNKHSYHFKGRAGLLAQLELNLDGKLVLIPTDANWKVAPDNSWDSQAPVISRFQMVVDDRVDMRKQIQDWKALNFIDTKWVNATPLKRTIGWPLPPKNARPQTLIPPWTNLVPRDLPYLIEQEERAEELLEARSMDTLNFTLPLSLNKQIDQTLKESYQAYRNKTGPVILDNRKDGAGYFLLFDLGQIRNGYPQLEIEGASGTEVALLYAPFLIDNQFSHQILDSDFKDVITLSGKLDKWEATYFKPVRYMALFFKKSSVPVQIHHIGIRHLEYPFIQAGSIFSKDAAWLNRYMEATAKTIKICTTDGYTDNYRERRQYAQTGYYAALGNYWLFGDHTLQRRYLVQVAQEQAANGIMPAYAPLAKDDYMVILDSNCLWIRSLRNYFLYSGDTSTVNKLVPAALKLLDLLHSFSNDLGLLYDPPYPYWLDHSFIDRRGANFCLNGHYLGALEDFAEVLDWLDRPESKVFKKRASLLRESLQNHFWDEQKGLFADAWIDGKRTMQFSEHANAMALAMKVAAPEQAERIIRQFLEEDSLNYTKRASGMTMVTPAMSYFVHKGLCAYGQIDGSMQLFRRRFDKMLAAEHNGTLWEEWWLDGTGRSGQFVKGKTRSDAQTESAFPPALFGEYLLGVQAIQPAWTEVAVRRQLSGLKNIEGSIPTPLGLLQVEWNMETTKSGTLRLEIPKSMTVKLDLETIKTFGKPIMINSIALSDEAQNKNFITLTEGKYLILF